MNSSLQTSPEESEHLLNEAVPGGESALPDLQAGQNFTDDCDLRGGVDAVWLLVGSTGAGEALQAFLNGFIVPPSAAFLYAQHYDPSLQEHLRELTPENPAFGLCLIDSHTCLVRGKILVVPPRNRVRFADNGCVSPGAPGWRNRYSPHIDQLLGTYSKANLPARGVIFLSGMGEDGARSLQRIAGLGVRIWAQDPASAVCGAMPQAAIDTGLVEYVSSPAGLAAAILAGL